MKAIKTLVFMVACILANTPQHISAQANERWTATYNGTASDIDQASYIIAGPEGSVYVTGASTGANGFDFVTIKYNRSGTTLWAKRYNGPGNAEDAPGSICIDDSCNIYVTGWSTGIENNTDFLTIKYDSAGNEKWTARYNGPGNQWDEAYSICRDKSGFVYVTGASTGIGGYPEITTIKYNMVTGAEVRTKRFSAGANIESESRSLVTDYSDNVYVSGWTQAAGDETGQTFDYITIKYDPEGNQLWSQAYNGPAGGSDRCFRLTVDLGGNVYVTGLSEGTGTSLDYATVKYNASGEQQWVRRYNGPANLMDIALGLEIDPVGGIVVSGQSQSADSTWDYLTVNYDESGTLIWESRFNGTGNNDDCFYSMTIDHKGGIYITGSSFSGSDFTTANITTIKYKNSGREEWIQRYTSSDYQWDEAYDLALDDSLNVFVSGYGFVNTTLSDNYLIIKYNQGNPASGELNCTSPVAVQCNSPYNGTTSSGTTSVYSYPGCCSWFESGPEVVHAVTVFNPGTLTATISGMTADLDVFILTACDKDNAVSFGDTTASISAIPATYYIVVDGFNGASGTYTLTITCPPPPDNRTVQNVTIAEDSAWCYDALNNIYIAGGGTSFIVNNGGYIELVAGNRIQFNELSRADPGGYLHGRISDQFCGSFQPGWFLSPEIPIIKEESQNLLADMFPSEKPNRIESFFIVYPNPTPGKFIVAIHTVSLEDLARIKVYNMLGNLLISNVLIGKSSFEADLTSQKPGIYLILVICGDRSGYRKIIRY